MSKNVEINILNNAGSYEILYPKTLMNNISGNLSLTQTTGNLSASRISNLDLLTSYGISVIRWVGTSDKESSYILNFPTISGKTARMLYLTGYGSNEAIVSTLYGTQAGIVPYKLIKLDGSFYETFNSYYYQYNQVTKAGSSSNYPLNKAIFNSTLEIVEIQNSGFTIKLKRNYDNINVLYMGILFYN